MILFFPILCLSCSHLYVQQETIDQRYLASNHVDTPDPMRAHPPIGQKLLIAWDFPGSLYDQCLNAYATVRLWNNEEKIYKIEIDQKRGTASLFFPERILTYRVLVCNQTGELIEAWEHQFWTELIAEEL